MKTRNLLFKSLISIFLLGILGFSNAKGQTLMHSYTFEEGTYDETTVYDQQGTVNGTLNGSMISIADGMATVSGAEANTDGYITFDGTGLALSTYSAVTMELKILAGNEENVDLYTMLAYFGATTAGENCFWMQPTREPNNESKWQAGSNDPAAGVWSYSEGNELDDGLDHHIVGVLTANQATYYLDGIVVANMATDVEGANLIATLGTDVANLFKGPDGWDDPNYNGSIYEFNIYDGAMDQAGVTARASDFFGGLSDDATLSALSSDIGELSPEFSPVELVYDITVPYGTTSLNLNYETSADRVVSVVVRDINSNEEIDIANPITWTEEDEGTDLEIVITALDGETQITYEVYIGYGEGAKSVELASLEASIGNYTADIDVTISEYELVVPVGTESVEVNGTAIWPAATVAGGGLVSLADGIASTTLTVTSEDKSATKDYTINIREAYVEAGKEYFIQHKLQGYVLGELDGYLKLQEPELNMPTQYFTFEFSEIGGAYYLKNQNNRYLTSTIDPVWDMVFVDELTAVADSFLWRLEADDTGSFRIATVAREGNEGKYVAPHELGLGNGVFNDKPYDWETVGNIWDLKDLYDLIDPYDTSLDTIVVNEGVSISPDVAKGVTDYYVVLPVGGLTTLNIGATATDEAATVTGDGAIDVSNGSGSFEITVTAPEPEYSTTVTIHYMEDTELALKHSYTFSDGTAKDIEGGADGTVMGGSITDGIYTGAEVGDYIELPAEQIAINTYPSVTFEMYISDDDATSNESVNTMVYYFGRTNEYGEGEDYTMTSMKCNSVVSVSEGSAWNFEQGVDAGINLTDDNGYHHLVTTITNDSLVFYVDGFVMDTAYFSGDNCIATLSNELAYILKSGYNSDNTWLGSVLEYNIYTGVMDLETVKAHNNAWPYEGSDADATLSNLTLDGVTIEGFNGAVLEYNVEVDELPAEVIATTKAEGATAVTTATATTIPGQTTILVTAVDGNTNTYTINYDVVTAVGEVNDLAVKVYPTVTDADFTVASEGASTVVTVYALTGRVVKQFETNSSIETFSLDQAGMYIVKVNTDGVTKLFKVIKK